MDSPAAIYHRPSPRLVTLLALTRGASDQPVLLLLYVSPASSLVQLTLAQVRCEARSRGQRQKDARALEDGAVVQLVDAAVRDDNTLHTHSLSRSGLGRIGADIHTVSAGVGSTLLVVCSPLGCILPRVGTWGPAAAGTHRS